MSLEPLCPWFKEKARHLPWRLPRQETEGLQAPDPWAVLVSEVMLQQTQVATVLPYFKRWMQRFPTYSDLATAHEDEVIKMWEGLGYYRRARGLQKAAIYLEQLGGFPQTRDQLLKVPGVGPYTSAALLSFAFHQRSVPVDGNVLRVASRWLGSDEDIAKASTAKKIEDSLLPYFPYKQPWVVAEALIELGATVCKPKNPHCHICPLKTTCIAHQKSLESVLPIKSRAQTSEKLWRSVAVVVHVGKETKWLVCKRATAGLFQGLWHFPFIERETSDFDPVYETERLSHHLGLELHVLQILKNRKHGFTRFSAHLSPLHLRTNKIKGLIQQEGWEYQWLDINTLKNLTFCSGHRQIRDELCQAQP